MATLKALNNKKRAIKAKLSRFSKFVEEFDNSQIDQLRVRLETTKLLLNEFDSILTEIENVTDKEDDLDELEGERGCFENKYYKTIVEAKQLIGSMTKSPNLTDLNSSCVLPTIKLPTLLLPEFSGDHIKWQQFKESFQSSIDNNANLNNSQRFRYLLPQLKGEALAAVSALEITDANYGIAWEILKSRFENKKLSVNNHIKNLVNLPSIQRENGALLRQLSDSLIQNVRCLKTLGVPVEFWDSIIIYLAVNKLDYNTRKAWESVRLKAELPTLDELSSFLNERCNVLEALKMHGPNVTKNDAYSHSGNGGNKRVSSFTATTEEQCGLCNEFHNLEQCNQFKAQDVKSRFEIAKKLRKCFICLNNRHIARFCKARLCDKCKRRHHNLLHFENRNKDVSDLESRKSVSKLVNNESTITATNVNGANTQVLLATANVYLIGYNGHLYNCRVLLDSASQSCFLTENICKIARLKRFLNNVTVNGVGSSANAVTHSVNVTVRSKHSRYEKEISCLVLPTITGKLPVHSFNADGLNLPKDIVYADENFNISGNIDMLLGAEIFWEVLLEGKIYLGTNMPVLQNTEFGFIMSGSMRSPQKRISARTSTHCSLVKEISKFWEIEEVDEVYGESNEDYCEKYFVQTTKRDADGQFIVKIPFRDIANLGDSRATALNRFYALENKLKRDSRLKEHYVKFMEEYERLGHMTRINEKSLNLNNPFCYLPHHGISKEESSTTMHRTVFEASAKTTTGFSLNDMQYVGPTVQDNLSEISRIWGPFGIFAPMMVRAKLLMQTMWEDKISCVKPIQGELIEAWYVFRKTLFEINEIRVPRFIFDNESILTELHEFCDASERAYGACIYSRTVDKHENVQVNLICAKSGVAPLKKLSIPRLELCGAFLLSKLMKVGNALKINIDSAHYWCDSTIVLDWLNAGSVFKVFVSNSFAEEISELKRNKYVKIKSKISNLCPFLDENGIVRVGGRLRNSKSNYGEKHSMLLPANHSLTMFIARSIHISNLHCGPQALLASIRQRYWPINGRNLTRRIVHDCVKCFWAKQNELLELGKFVKDDQNWSKIRRFLAERDIESRFIPPRAPHFGGLWEAGVKSVKFHLKRVCGLSNFAHEEFYTLIAQIEVILNSRPLSPLSSSSDDLNPLTPGHFLIGGPVTSVVDENLENIADNRLSHFQRIQAMTQHFWKRWSKEYLASLQQRTKWKTDEKRITPHVGDLVVIKEDNLPPCKWLLGRILELHPGDDGTTRVVTVKTTAGNLKRAVVRICVLPVEVQPKEC